MNSLDFLTDVLCQFCKSNSLELQSADDILHSDYHKLSSYQREWLSNYIEIWDIIANY